MRLFLLLLAGLAVFAQTADIVVLTEAETSEVSRAYDDMEAAKLRYSAVVGRIKAAHSITGDVEFSRDFRAMQSHSSYNGNEPRTFRLSDIFKGQ